MVFEKIVEKRLVGFSYYPLIENVLGFFFLFMALSVPILFYRFNGFKLEQWDEWLFIVGFFFLFFFLGKSLAYQNMIVSIKNNVLRLEQDMREPGITMEIPIEKWQGAEITTIKDDKNREDLHIIIIKQSGGENQEFYQTTSYKEAKQMINLLNKIHSENRG